MAKTDQEPTLWFQITLNKDGSVANCSDSLPGIDDKGRRIYYVQAASKEDAIRILAERWTRHQIKLRERRLQLSAAAKQIGHCSCGKPADAENGRQCVRCYSASVRYRERRRLGLIKPHSRVVSDQDKADRAAREAARNRSRKGATDQFASTRRIILCSALDAFDSMPPARFRGWLVAQIQEQQDKIDAKRKAAGLSPQAWQKGQSNTARVIQAALGQVRKHGKVRIYSGARRVG